MASSKTKATDPKTEDKTTELVVAKGKALTSKIGILPQGSPVQAKYFAGGQKTLDSLIERGYCVESVK